MNTVFVIEVAVVMRDMIVKLSQLGQTFHVNVNFVSCGAVGLDANSLSKQRHS